ncbi:MFS transporter [Sabulicella rubraurantiaca]|uniref:MFS transporter n=1 Tax=Sabulicella rubraurantiaca TaxID=2811429 RepID=UPI001A959202|nr:MFS transporter [Sabulicella rubraurantiaca]
MPAHTALALGAARARPAALRNALVAAMAFLTLVDLFATQAILPALAAHYRVSPSEMGTAVNASTLGMAVAGLGIALLGAGFDRQRGVAGSLLLLALPTALLASAPDLASFAALRVMQGLLMASAFALALAHLGERFGPMDAPGVFAAYITGNVLSNLVGRLVSAGLAEHLGLMGNFYGFAALNLAGAALSFLALERNPVRRMAPGAVRRAAETAELLHDGRVRGACGIGFGILFAFIGVFSYVNFVLVEPPFGLGMMELGLVYFVFLPAVLTTPAAGLLARRWGARRTLLAGLALATMALPLLLAGSLPAVLAGLGLVAVGTFGAQAVVTGYVGRVARGRAGAGGLYLASYFAGGLAGSAVLGSAYEALGWPGCVAGAGAALLAAAAFASRGMRGAEASVEGPQRPS